MRISTIFNFTLGTSLVFILLLLPAGIAYSQTVNLEMPTPVPFPAGFQCFAIGDLDNDGNNDILLSSESGLEVRWGAGDGHVTSLYSITQEIHAKALHIADFNGDSELDIVVLQYEEEVPTFMIVQNDGGRNFSLPVEYVVSGVSSNTNLHTINNSDFNSDGLTDFIVAGDTELITLLNTGSGFDISILSTNELAYGRCTQTGDFNEDNNQDIIVAARIESFVLFSGNGDGTFQDPVAFYVNTGYNENIVASDLNNDGHLDIAVANAELANLIYVYNGAGDGTFQYAASHYSGGGSDLTAADVNGDSF